MDAGALAAEIASFRLHLAAEGKAPKTIRLYTEAVSWFAAARLLGQAGKTGWEQADARDVQEWMARLLSRYSDAYASNQYRALQQFFKWLSAEDDIPDPMAGLRPPHVADRPVPVFSGRELSRLEGACAGCGFGQRRDAAIIAVLGASGIRLSELAGIRYDQGHPGRGDVDLWEREITVRGKGRRTRTVKVGHDAARSLDRYLRMRARHPLAHRPELWLGVNGRGPLTASGIYQAVARRGRLADSGAPRDRRNSSVTCDSRLLRPLRRPPACGLTFCRATRAGRPGWGGAARQLPSRSLRSSACSSSSARIDSISLRVVGSLSPIQRMISW
jgi:site-specific recombinase XerC